MYIALALYDLTGDFLAYTIAKTDDQGVLLKLHTTNIWAEADGDDLMAQLERLNDQSNIKVFWPDVRDPEVQDLLVDETWEPVDRIPVEVVDNENSVFIYKDPPREEDGFPGTIDEDASVIVMKWVEAPSPSDTLHRVKKACEVVARRRMEHQ